MGELTRRGKPTTRERGVLQTPRALCDKLSYAYYSMVRSRYGLRSRSALAAPGRKDIIITIDLLTARLVKPIP